MALTKTDLAWFAGVIDGEGSIGVGYSKARPGYQTQIQLENTNEALMKRAMYIVESLGARPRLATRIKNNVRNSKWKVSYRYCITKHSEIQAVLTAIEPYLVAKKQQAKLLLDWVIARQALGRSPRGFLLPHTDQSNAWYSQLKELNK